MSRRVSPQREAMQAAQCLATGGYSIEQDGSAETLHAAQPRITDSEGGRCPATLTVTPAVAERLLFHWPDTPAATTVGQFYRFGEVPPDHVVMETLAGRSPGGVEIARPGYMFPNGARLEQGSVIFRDGHYFVEGGPGTVSGIEIFKYGRHPVQICVDGAPLSNMESYVSLHPTEGRLAARNVRLRIVDHVNPFLPSKKSTYKPTEFRIHQTTLQIVNRTHLHQVPLVTLTMTSLDSGGWLYFGERSLAFHFFRSPETGVYDEANLVAQVIGWENAPTNPMEIVFGTPHAPTRPFYTNGHHCVRQTMPRSARRWVPRSLSTTTAPSTYFGCPGNNETPLCSQPPGPWRS